MVYYFHMKMECIPVRTRAMLPPRDDLYQVLDESLPRLREGDILFVSAKVVAIHQGRCVRILPPGAKGARGQKERIVKRESEWYARSHLRSWPDLYLSIKEHTLIANAGVDESNAAGHYILWPRRAPAAAKEIRGYLQKKSGVKNLAVVIVDSHILPLRHGTVGISIGSAGMEPVCDYRGTPDIFGRIIRHTNKNVVDPLAAMAVSLMGEGNERTPLLILRGAGGWPGAGARAKGGLVRFTDRDTSRALGVRPEDDLYAPFWRGRGIKKK